MRTAQGGAAPCSPAASIQGGSTITQQLIKNLTTQYDDVTVKRKVLEMFRALEFDKTLLQGADAGVVPQLYLPGPPRAATGWPRRPTHYFGKELSVSSSLAECASLICITNNPSALRPLHPPPIWRTTSTARGLVLDAMMLGAGEHLPRRSGTRPWPELMVLACRSGTERR